jgi:threonine dehydratase
MQNVLPTADDVAEAHLRIRDWIVETPVLESDALSRRIGARVLLKAECLQRGGSFKIRGALNRILQLKADERSAGVVARIAAERGAAIVPPFDHAQVIAGQGTAALELGRALALKHVTLDALYAPCSGGGLVAGSALAIKSVFAGCAVYAVEPVGYTRLADSLLAGERRVLSGHPPTLCDGLRAPAVGAITFAINRRELAGAVAVDDDAVLEAVALAAEHLKVVLEPSGAAALAALLHAPARGGCVGVILSGGNVDAELLSKAVMRRATI